MEKRILRYPTAPPPGTEAAAEAPRRPGTSKESTKTHRHPWATPVSSAGILIWV